MWGGTIFALTLTRAARAIAKANLRRRQIRSRSPYGDSEYREILNAAFGHTPPRVAARAISRPTRLVWYIIGVFLFTRRIGPLGRPGNSPR